MQFFFYPFLSPLIFFFLKDFALKMSIEKKSFLIFIQTKSGEKLNIDLMVTATGYKGQEYVVEELFGKSVVDKIGPIWGFDDERQELRNMWMQTKQPGLWFHAGSLAQCRIFSKFLALQIKAIQNGIIS